MATVREHLQVLYPHLVDAGSPRFAGVDVLAWAEEIALDYRPSCLPESRANLAMAHYVAHVVAQRAMFGAEGIAASMSGRAITSAKEGDVQVDYAFPVSASDGGATSPYDAWKLLWNMCARGGLMTRFG